MTLTRDAAFHRRSAPIHRLATAALIGLAMLTAAGGGPAVAASGVTLRYGLKPGNDYDQSGTMHLQIEVDPSSLPPGLAPLVQSMAGGMKQEIEFKGILDLQEKAADGATPFEFRVVEAHGSFTRGTETKEVPAVAAVKDKPPLKGQFSADGRRVTMEPPAAAEGGGPDRRREQLAQALPELPEKPLAVGDAFEAIVPLRLPSAGGHGDTPVETRWVYTLKAVDGHRADFDVRQIIPESSGSTMSKGRSLKLSGGASGTASFDLKEGLFTRIALDAAIDLTYAVPMPPGISIPGDTSGAAASGDAAAAAPTPPVVTLKSKLTGPIRIEMGRHAAR